MSRINEALQRAGQGIPDKDVSDSLDQSFVSGEESQTDASGASHEPPEAVDAHAGDTLPATTVDTAPVRAHATGRVMATSPVTLPMELRRNDIDEQVEIRDVLRMLMARWKLIASIIIIALGLAVAYNKMATPIYQARARLVIEPDTTQVVQRAVAEDTYRGDYFGTQLDILRSRDLARRTLVHLGDLSSDPATQEGQISRLIGSLNVAPARAEVSNRTVNVSVLSTDPKYAARMANGVAQTYVEQNLELRRQGNRDAAKWLNERLAELREQVTTSAGALQQYRERRGTVSLDDKQNIVVQKMMNLNTSAAALRSERAEKQAVYQQLAALQQSGAPLDTFQPIMSNPVIQGLKTEVGTLHRRRDELAEKLGDNHPDMVAVNAEIATTERRLNDEISKAAAAIRNDYETAVAREKQVVGALEQQTREVLDLNQKQIGYDALQRDATSTQQIFQSVLQRLREAELAAELQTNNVRILDAALVPGAPILPRSSLNLMIALLLGAGLGIGLAFALEYFNPRITDAADVVESLSLPVLGVAPRIPGIAKGRVRIDNLPPQFQEAIRSVRTRIVLAPGHSEVRTLAVTSTMPREGKTLVAASLAASMASTGRRVLLVDGDLRRAQVHKIFNTRTSPGLANILAGEAKPSEALIEASIEGLFLMPAGEHHGQSELLDTEAVRRLLEGLSQVFDIIVVDCPPAMALADASIVANVASSVLFVVGSGSTNTEAARAAVDRLSSVQAQIVGVVLNNAKLGRGSAYGYSYYQLGNPA